MHPQHIHLILLDCLLGNCGIDFLNFPHCQVKNFESVRMKLKFCSHLSKVPKAKAKVNKV
jgi:hypothetical protein